MSSLYSSVHHVCSSVQPVRCSELSLVYSLSIQSGRGACLALRKGSFIQANLQHLILTAQVQIPADGDCKWLIERRIAPGTC